MKRLSICAALILLAACRPAEETTAGTSGTEVTGTMTETAATETTIQTTAGTSTEAPALAHVEVKLVDHRIEMPSTLSAGRTHFSVTNSGKVEHSFEIEGQGIEEALPKHLKPGESGTLEVDLRPGTYKVYCPVRDHDTKRGMSLQLTVS